MRRDRNRANPNRPDFILTNLTPCPHPTKTKFRTRNEAKRCLRLKKPKLDKDTYGNLPKPYLCSCGAWHLGHPPGGKRLRVEFRTT